MTTATPPPRPARIPRPRLPSAWALALLAVLAADCGPRSIPERLQELPPDFKRVAYVQNVTPTAATIVWQTHSPEGSSLNYWTGDSVNKFNIVVDTVSIDHAVRLDELQPDTEYSYQVRTWEGRFTEARAFRTAPQPGTRKKFKLLVFGDSGEGTEGQLAVADKMAGEDPALVIHVGDVAYDNGSETDFDFRHFAVYKDLMDGVPFYPVLGNHDVRTESGAPYLNAFYLPADNPTGTERYYSFQYDNVFFVALDSNTGPTYSVRFGDLRNPQSAQYRWLGGELERAAAEPTVDWIVAYMHHPPFSSGRGIGGHGSDLPLRDALFPLFERYGVDLVFTGHDHHYERTFAIRCEAGAPVTAACLGKHDDPKQAARGSGTVFVVTGAGGGPFAWRAVGVSWWTAFARQTYQFVRVEVEGESVLVQSVDSGGAVIDEVRIQPPGGEQEPAQRAAPANERPDRGGRAAAETALPAGR